MLHAIVIGVDAARDPRIPPLDHARADAEGVAAALRDRADSERQITLLIDDRATKTRIARVVTEELPRRVRPEDAVLLYFAGHGCPELEGALLESSIHLVAHDTELARFKATAIDVLSELGAWVRRLPARVVCIVLDASFNGSPGGRTFEGPGLRSGPRIRALERLSPTRAAVGGRFAILTACSDKEVAREDSVYKHGVFTHHLIGTLRSPDLAGRRMTPAMLHAAVFDAVHCGRQGVQSSGHRNFPLVRLYAARAPRTLD
jgi:uncharacterized caspase-like protein